MARGLDYVFSKSPFQRKLFCDSVTTRALLSPLVPGRRGAPAIPSLVWSQFPPAISPLLQVLKAMAGQGSVPSSQWLLSWSSPGAAGKGRQGTGSTRGGEAEARPSPTAARPSSEQPLGAPSCCLGSPSPPGSPSPRSGPGAPAAPRTQRAQPSPARPGAPLGPPPAPARGPSSAGGAATGLLRQGQA